MDTKWQWIKIRFVQVLMSVPLAVFVYRRLVGIPAGYSDVCTEIRTKNRRSKEKGRARYRDYDHAFLPFVKPLAAAIPESNGQRFYRPWSGRVGLLSDEFLFHTYKDVADCTAIHPGQWERQVSQFDMVLLITGWHGFDDEWAGISEEGTPARKEVYRFLSACRKAGVATVFYSIEDPPNYDSFLGLAQRCDYVFTTAEEMVPCYQRDCGHTRVQTLLFSVNPAYHNPVGSLSENRMREVLFAGSWMDIYENRSRDVCTLFDGVQESGTPLHIIDRNFASPDKQYAFPARYAPCISPAVPHRLLQRIHKLFVWALNLNSVTDSLTMFANRTYELEAAGNVILSNYGPSVQIHLPAIFTVHDSSEAASILSSYSDEELLWRQGAGIRHAFGKNTCYDRFAVILRTLGKTPPHQGRKMAVVVDEKTPDLCEMFRKQTFRNSVLLLPEELEKSYQEFDMVAFWQAGTWYSPFYLEDMADAFKYTNVQAVTLDAFWKNGKFIPGIQHGYTDQIKSKTRSVFWAEDFTLENLLSFSDGGILQNVYGLDGSGVEEHPLPCSADSPDAMKLTVLLVPGKTGGMQTFCRSGASLLRSRLFQQMDIILAVTGDEDLETCGYIELLCRRYPQFRTAEIQGEALPKSMFYGEYFTVIQPFDEAVHDGYSEMYAEARKQGMSCICGESVLLDRTGYTVKTPHRESVLAYWAQENEVPAGAALFRTDAAPEQVGLFNEKHLWEWYGQYPTHTQEVWGREVLLHYELPF